MSITTLVLLEVLALTVSWYCYGMIAVRVQCIPKHMCVRVCTCIAMYVVFEVWLDWSIVLYAIWAIGMGSFLYHYKKHRHMVEQAMSYALHVYRNK